MAKDVIMPALGMAQETGILLQWLKAEGEQVTQGEPLMEIETDKATVEVEAPASGTLVNVTAGPGDEVPVGQVIALDRKNSVIGVTTGEGVLGVLKVQLEGKRAMSAADFLRGQRDWDGMVLPS